MCFYNLLNEAGGKQQNLPAATRLSKIKIIWTALHISIRKKGIVRTSHKLTSREKSDKLEEKHYVKYFVQAKG